MNQLCRLVAEILAVDPPTVAPDTGPGSVSQWDSLAHLQLVAAIEEKYGVQFTTEEIITIMSVDDFAAILKEKGVTVV